MSQVPFPLNEDEQVLYKLHSQRPVYTGKDILLYLIPGDFLMLLAFYIAFEMDFPVVIPEDIQAFLSEPLALILMFLLLIFLMLYKTAKRSSQTLMLCMNWGLLRHC